MEKFIPRRSFFEKGQSELLVPELHPDHKEKEEQRSILVPGEWVFVDVMDLVYVDREDNVLVDYGHIEEASGNTNQCEKMPKYKDKAIKVVSDFDGLLIDATSLSYETVLRFFKHNPIRFSGEGTWYFPKGITISTPVASELRLPIGVLYPFMPDLSYLNSEIVMKFNQEEKRARNAFRQHYESTYSIDYVFACEAYRKRI